MELLKAAGMDTVKVFIGGIIPEEDIPALLKIGVTAVYGPGTSTQTVVKDVEAAVVVGTA